MINGLRSASVLVFYYFCAGWNQSFAEGNQQRVFTTDTGGCPAASPFLLLRQKKVTKEKATPSSSALTGCPALLTSAGRCGTRARSSNVLMVWFVLALRQSSRTSPAFAPLLGDSHGAPCRNATTEINLVIPAQAGIQVLYSQPRHRHC